MSHCRAVTLSSGVGSRDSVMCARQKSVPMLLCSHYKPMFIDYPTLHWICSALDWYQLFLSSNFPVVPQFPAPFWCRRQSFSWSRRPSHPGKRRILVISKVTIIPNGVLRGIHTVHAFQWQFVCSILLRCGWADRLQCCHLFLGCEMSWLCVMCTPKIIDQIFHCVLSPSSLQLMQGVMALWCVHTQYRRILLLCSSTWLCFKTNAKNNGNWKQILSSLKDGKYRPYMTGKKLYPGQYLVHTKDLLF